MTLAELLAAQKEAAQKGTEFDLESGIKSIVAAEISAVNEKNSELLGKLKTQKAVIDALPEDYSAEAWNDMSKKVADGNLATLKNTEQLDALRKQLGDAHAQDMVKLNDKTKALTRALETELIDNAAKSALIEAKGNAPLLLPHVKGNLKVVAAEDGTYSTVVVGANGEERYSLSKAGEKMGVAELVGEFRANPVYQGAFDAPNGGGGTPPPGGNGGGKNPFKKGPDYSVTEQSILANKSPEIAAQMKAAAQGE